MANSESKTGTCKYHFCKKKTKVYRCPHCERYFCKEHLQPEPVGIPDFKSTDKETLAFMKEWRKPGGHPCIPYLDYWKAERERKEKDYDQVLDEFLKPKSQKGVREPIITRIEKKIRRKVPIFEKINNYWYWHKNAIMPVLIVLLIALFYLSEASYRTSNPETSVTTTMTSISTITTIPKAVKRNVNEFNTQLLERRIFEEINLEREKHNLTPLRWNEELSEMARNHSQDMAENNFLAHESSNRDTLEDRLNNFHICYTMAGENIMELPMIKHYETLAKESVEGWMNSEGHRKNVLTKAFDETGIGIALQNVPKSKFYITQDFIFSKYPSNKNLCKGHCWEECASNQLFYCTATGGVCR